MLSWCYSMNSDVSSLLRRHAVFSEMILNHDLRTITGRPTAKLNHVQRDILTSIVKNDPETCLFVWGSAARSQKICPEFKSRLTKETVAALSDAFKLYNDYNLILIEVIRLHVKRRNWGG